MLFWAGTPESPGSGVTRSGVMASEVPSPAPLVLAGVGSADVSGTTNSGDSDSSKAITDGTGFGGRGAFARAFAGAGFAFGFAFGADGFLSAGALRFTSVMPGFFRVGSGGDDEMTSGFAGANCSDHARGNGRSSGVTDGATLATGGGRSATRRSGTATRRSSQGKAKPGSPGSSPPRVRLNSKAWASRESNSARPSRLQSWLVRLPPPQTGPREMASRIPAAPASVTSPAVEPVQAG